MSGSGNPSRLPAIAKIVVFDIAGPLALYWWLRSQGWSTVTSLVVSGGLPAVGVILGVARKRWIDVVGVVVLLGIAVGTVLGLASGSARLVLLEGSVPTAIFGAVCLASIWTSRPLMYRFAVEFMVTTVVWGVAYGRQARRKGERLGAEAAGRGETPPPLPT